MLRQKDFFNRGFELMADMSYYRPKINELILTFPIAKLMQSKVVLRQKWKLKEEADWMAAARFTLCGFAFIRTSYFVLRPTYVVRSGTKVDQPLQPSPLKILLLPLDA